MILKCTSFAIILMMTSCTTASRYSGEPMELKDALIAVGKAIREADAAKEGKPTGLVPSEVVVGFEIVNSSKDAGNLSLQVIPAAGVTAGGGISGELTSKKGSSIVVKYNSILLASKDTIIGSKTPTQLQETVREAGGVTTLGKKQSLVNE